MFFRGKHVCQTCGGPLAALELNAVEIDHCLACAGTWLDAGEIEQICLLAGVAPGRLSQALAGTSKGKKGKRRCPRCDRALRGVTIESGAAPLVIDRCPAGHGFWFDPGEMLALVERFEDGEEGAVARFLGEMFPKGNSEFKIQNSK